MSDMRLHFWPGISQRNRPLRLAFLAGYAAIFFCVAASASTQEIKDNGSHSPFVLSAGSPIVKPVKPPFGPRFDVPNGSALLINPLNDPSSTVSSVLASPPEGTIFLQFVAQKQQYNFNQFQKGVWLDPNEAWPPGAGALIYNPGPAFSVPYPTRYTPSAPQLLFGLNLLDAAAMSQFVLPLASNGERIDRFENGQFESFVFEERRFLFGFWFPSLPQFQPDEAVFYESLSGPAPQSSSLGGTVIFSNYVPARGVDVRFTLDDGTPIATEDHFVFFELWGGPSEDGLMRLTEQVPLLNGPLAGYFNGGVVNVPTVAAGGIAYLQVRYFSATGTHMGSSSTVSVTLGGGILPPAVLTGLILQYRTVGAPPLFALSRGNTQVTSSSGGKSDQTPRQILLCGVNCPFTTYFLFLSRAQGIASISTAGTPFDTVLSVFDSAAVLATNPPELTCNDDRSPTDSTSAVTFSADAAKYYLVAVGNKSGAQIDSSLQLEYGYVDPTRILGVTGNGAFGTVLIGSSRTLIFQIVNSGNSPLHVNNVSYPAGFSGNWRSGTIDPGKSVELVVTFSPSQAGLYNAAIDLFSDSTLGNSSISVAGTGQAPALPAIVLSGNLTFGNIPVGTTTSQTFKISNTGNALLTVNSITYPEAFTGNWPGGSLLPGSSQEVQVTFSPAAQRNYTGTITVNSDGTGLNTIQVNGTAIAPLASHIQVVAALSFGKVQVGRSASQILSIKNTGDLVVHVNQIACPAGFSTDWTGGTVQIGSSQPVTITFSPTVPIDYQGTVTVQSDSMPDKYFLPASGTGFRAAFNSRVLKAPIGSSFHIPVVAGSGETLVLEASRDLHSWFEVQRLFTTDATSELLDAVITGKGARFYRFHLE